MKRYLKSNEQQKHVADWRLLKVGQQLTMICDEFDGYSETPCTVTEVLDDHVIAVEDNAIGRPQTLWIDDFNQDMFYYR